MILTNCGTQEWLDFLLIAGQCCYVVVSSIHFLCMLMVVYL